MPSDKAFYIVYTNKIEVDHDLLAHMFAGPMHQASALILKSCGKNITANVRDRALSRTIDHLTHMYMVCISIYGGFSNNHYHV